MGRRRLSGQILRITLSGLTLLGVAFLIVPLGIVVLSSFGTDPYLRFPPSGLTLRWYQRMLTLTELLRPLLVSLQVAVMTTVLAGLSGTLMAIALVRAPWRGRRLVDALFLGPLVVPGIVTGSALLVFFNVMRSTDSVLNLVIGHTIVTLPFVIQTVRAVLERSSLSVEHAAMTLGASRAKVFLRITLPLIQSGMLAGMLFAFVMSFDEFVLAVLLTGGPSTTFPVALFGYLRFSLNPTVAALSTALIVFSGLAIAVFDRLVGLHVLFGITRLERT